jgi:hypothetical protein
MKTEISSYFLIIDLEATCSDNNSTPRHKMEIIEIGAVMLNRTTWEIDSEFQQFIQPVINPQLTAFCRELTSIYQSDVELAPIFTEAMSSLEKWLESFTNYIFCSWGEYDKKQFIQDCKYHNIAYPFGLHEGERCQQLKSGLTAISDLFRSPLSSSFLFFPFLQKDLGAWSPWENLYAIAPQQFKPERFLERQFSPYEFIPFGAGARRCIGDALAQFEMKLVLATILSRYQLALADNQPETPQRRGITLAPARGVKMVITGQRVRPESQLTMVST